MNFTRIVALIVKELLAAFRDPKARIALIAPPLVQLLLYAYAATMDVNHVAIGVLNQDWGLASTQFLARLERTPAFAKIEYYQSLDEVRRAIDAQDVLAVVAIDQDFSRALARGESPSVQLLLDGRRSNSAQIVNNYFATIVATFARDYASGAAAAPVSEVVDRTWYNPNRDFRKVMAPSLLATLTMTTVLMIVGMSVARERELGTFEQLLVSPARPHEIIVGKTVPGMLIGMAEGSIIIAYAHWIFGVPLTGSVPLLYLAMAVYLAAVIGVGLFISSLVATQQQAMLGAFTFVAPAILLSGFATPISNMPDWLQMVTLGNPARYFLVVLKGVFLKDMPPGEILAQIGPMILIAVITLWAASWLFRHRLE